MEQVIERKIFELPLDLRVDFFNKLEKLFQQEDDAMVGLIDRTRKSLKLTMNDYQSDKSAKVDPFSARSLTPSQQETLRIADVADRPTTPVALFQTKNNESNFEEERDKIMNRMSGEQKKLENEKEKQAAILKNKMNAMANKQQETEVKADQMMKEADQVEKMDMTERDKQANMLKEKLDKKQKNMKNDGAKPFVIDLP